MPLMKYITLFLFLFINFGCNKEIVRENKPIQKEIGVSQIIKSDIDDVLEVHVDESRRLLRELMSKLYKRNPRELKKSSYKIAEENIKNIESDKNNFKKYEFLLKLFDKADIVNQLNN